MRVATWRVCFAVMVLQLACVAAAAAQECRELPAISEETKYAVCPSHFLLSGLRCEGRYCDKVVPTCCKYLNDRYQSPLSLESLPSPGHGGTSEADERWTPWFSEEGTGHATRTVALKGVSAGIGCRGSYCDDLRLLVSSPGVTVSEAMCGWTGPISEESQAGAQCRAGSYINDVKCEGRYCDNISLQCCRVAYRENMFPPSTPPPEEVCVTLPPTGRGYSASAQVAIVGTPIGSTSTTSRSPDICPSGTAMRGMQCYGDYCSQIRPTCCTYGGYESSGKLRPAFRVAPPISEETGPGRRNSISSASEVLAGLRCSGNYCDVVEAYLVRNTYLHQTVGDKRTLGPFSEEDGVKMCPANYFVTGLKCTGSYCDNLTMTCTRAHFQDDYTALDPFIEP